LNKEATPPPPHSAEEATEQRRGLFQRLKDRYGIKGQQDRIHRAEALFQAASRQASDPYV
jgi:hypothetical protein